MLFAIDSDDVIVNFAPSWLKAYNEQYNDNMSIEKFMEYRDLHTTVKPECGEDIYKLIERPGFFSNLPAINGSVETVNTLLDKGHKVMIVTSYSNNGEICKGKIEWYEKYLPRIMDNKSLVLCPAGCKRFVKCDVFIDDYIKNIREHHETNKHSIQYLVTAIPNIKEAWKNRLPALYHILKEVS